MKLKGKGTATDVDVVAQRRGVELGDPVQQHAQWPLAAFCHLPNNKTRSV